MDLLCLILLLQVYFAASEIRSSLLVNKFSAATAAAPAQPDEQGRSDGARVSTQVASHTKGLPNFHGNKDMPSGLLPSSRARPLGSSTAGTPTATRARRMMLLTFAYLAMRPALRLHERPWCPRLLATSPQWQRHLFEVCFRNSIWLSRIRPVGAHVGKSFVPLTEIPPPHIPHITPGQPSRRHLDDDCTKKPPPREVAQGARIEIFGDYYDEKVMKTVATVIFPDHIDHKHFEVTTQVPYFTVGPIEAIGYHPSTMKSEHPSECEKIYQDHLDDQYSEESKDYSEESLEMARMPLFPADLPASIEERMDKLYDDIDM